MHRLTVLCARHPWATLLLTLALTAAAGWSAMNTGTALGTDAGLGANHPAVKEFEAFLERFGGGYPIVIAYECSGAAACNGIFDPAALEMAHAVSRQILASSFVSRVSSPAATRLLVPSADLGLEARYFVVDGVVAGDADLVRRALTDPLWSKALVSDRGRVGAIVVELSSTESAALLSVTKAIEESTRPYEATFRFYVAGEAAMFAAAQRAGLESAARAGALTGGMLFVALLFLIRSVAGVVASLVTIGVASAWTIGLLPVLGWQQSELTNGAATLILVIGCADCVHFIAHYLEIRSNHQRDTDALEATSRWVLAPCFLTTATTVGAFGSFASGEVLAVTQFGVMAAIGVALAFVLTFTLFPALLLLLPPRSRRAQHSIAWQEVLGRLSSFGVRRRWLVLAVALLMTALGGIGIPKLRVEMDVAELWGPEHPVTRAIDFVSEHLQLADRLEIDLGLPPEANVEAPGTLHAVADLEDDLAHLTSVGRPQSIVTVLRHIHHLVSGTDSGALPSSEAAIGELLFLASSGAPGVLDPWLTLDQRHIRISLEVDSLSMEGKQRLLTEVNELLISGVPPGWSYVVTGPLLLTYRYGEDFRRSQTNIVSASSLIVIVMIGAYLRSLSWAMLAVIPNAIALILLFGTMGHWGILLNFGSAIVAPIAIGIAADDTIHFLTAYSRERRSGREPVVALHGAIVGVGEAVIATAVALSLGFLSMMTSPMATVADMGLLCAVAILGATAADLLVLPALIATVASWKGFGRLPATRG